MMQQAKLEGDENFTHVKIDFAKQQHFIVKIGQPAQRLA